MSLVSKNETAPTDLGADAALLRAIAMANGGVIPTRAKGVELCPVSVAIRKARKGVLDNLKPGDLVADQGIYLGKYSPIDRDGISLGKTFNVFAAPQDLPERMTYVDTVKFIAELVDWYGFNGTNYPTDKEIYAALNDGSYDGGWIIPTRELLVGTAPDSAEVIRSAGKGGIPQGEVIQPDNLFDHQNIGAFKGTVGTDPANCSWYWTSTERRGEPSSVFSVWIRDGVERFNHKDTFLMRCRLVRLVEVLSV